MPYNALEFEQKTVSTTVLDVTDFTVPQGVVHVELQASANSLRYRYDGIAPTTAKGLLLTTNTKILLPFEQFQAIKMIRNGASDCTLEVNYLGSP